MTDNDNTVQGFSNVRRTRFWQRGFLASQSAYVAGALILVILAMSLASENFLTAGNIANITRNFSFIAIAALGMTLVIITGGIDLSVGSTMVMAATATAMTMTGLDAVQFYPFPGSALIISMAAGLGISAFIGLLNGVLIAKLKLSPFVTTLGALSIFRGLAYILTEGRGSFATGPDRSLFIEIMSGRLFGTVPYSFLYLIFFSVLMYVVLHHTRWGRHVFAIGGNEDAGRMTGVNVDRRVIEVYVICGLAAGFNGVIISGWLGSAPANLAQAYELTIIAAAVIGGANLAGGVGGAAGAIIGCLLIEVIRNGLVLAQVSPYWQTSLVGLIIVAAVLVDRFRSLRSG